METLKKMSVFTLAMGILLVIVVIMTMIAGGQLLNLGLDWVLGVENCYYAREAIAQECSKDINGIKRDIANSVSMLVIAAPMAWFTFKQLKKK